MSNDQVDNRFAYMRKHLGISQKEASEIFKTRLDTIKKWDSGRLFVPSDVLEEMYDMVRHTHGLIEAAVRHYIEEDEDNDLDEVYLNVPSIEELDDMGMPRSQGWAESVVGAIIGRLPTVHAYGAKVIPAHVEDDYCWYDEWDWVVGESHRYAMISVLDEQRFTQELVDQIAAESFEVRYDPAENVYDIGIKTDTLSNRAKRVWLRVCSSRSDSLFADEPLTFNPWSNDEYPYVLSASEEKLAVGLAYRNVGEDDPDDDTIEGDTTSLAELIFEKLREKYATSGQLAKTCRRLMRGRFRGDPENPDKMEEDSEFIIQLWDKRFVSHNLLVAIFQEVRKLGLILDPATLQGVGDIIQKSEPAMHGTDQQYLTIDMGKVEITVLLDIRDIIDADKTGKTLRDEFGKAVEVILKLSDQSAIGVLPPYSEVSAELFNDEDQER